MKKAITKGSGHSVKRLIFDLDGVIALHPEDGRDYVNRSRPDTDLVELMRVLSDKGFHIVIQTARKMRSSGDNVGKALKLAGKDTLEWLDLYGIPYDEIHFGKPWGQIYFDDLALNYSREDMLDTLEKLIRDN